jgi:F0F1-type ATP synthase membrane subunit b/b'
VHVQLSEDGSDLAERAQRIKTDRVKAEQAEAAASELSRELARELAAAKVPVRDIGSLLDVSYQRASQLASPSR